MPVTSKDLYPVEPVPTDELSLAYNAIVKRVNELKGKYHANTARQPEVVYMSEHYYQVFREKREMERIAPENLNLGDSQPGKSGDSLGFDGELRDGATLTERLEKLIVIKVDTEFKYLQVGVLFDSALNSVIPVNIVPSRLR